MGYHDSWIESWCFNLCLKVTVSPNIRLVFHPDFFDDESIVEYLALEWLSLLTFCPDACCHIWLSSVWRNCEAILALADPPMLIFSAIFLGLDFWRNSGASDCQNYEEVRSRSKIRARFKTVYIWDKPIWWHVWRESVRDCFCHK